MVLNGYIFTKGKDNKDGSINWRCQNSRKVGQERCPVSCTTLNGEFIRRPPNQHIVDGHVKHTIPFSITRGFTTYSDNQTGMTFHIVQGEREMAMLLP